MHKLIDFICDELDEIERKAEKEGKLSMTEVQYADTLAHMKKNLLTAEAMTGEGEYSRDDGYMPRGGSYARGRNARRDTMGRYSRTYDRGGYSRTEDDMESVIADLRNMADDLPADKQREVHKFIQKIEQM